MDEEQAHRIEAYRDLRQRLLNARSREQWELERARDRGQRAKVLKRVARLEMLSEVIEGLEDLAGL